jgi:hypothetical protein
LHDSLGEVFLSSAAMRGSDKLSGELFSYVKLEDRVRLDHRRPTSYEILYRASDQSQVRAEFKYLERVRLACSHSAFLFQNSGAKAAKGTVKPNQIGDFAPYFIINLTTDGG